jgi:hypothetical protein
MNHCDRRTVQSETYRDESLIDVQYGQRHTVINHCDRRTVQSETYRDKSLIDVQYGLRHTVINPVIYYGMSLTVLYVYHSDLSRYVSDCTVCLSQVSLIWMIHCIWIHLYIYFGLFSIESNMP